MTVAESALAALVNLLASAVNPDEVRLLDIPPSSQDETDPAAVSVCCLALERIGRSRRDGPVLDLDLVASVRARGPQSLKNVESMILAIEADPQYSVLPLPRPASPPADLLSLGFLVHVPVSLRLTEARGQQVREPLQLRTVVGRRLSGVVVDSNGEGIGGAYVRVSASGLAVACDSAGRFAVLSAPEPVQQFTLEFQGRSKTVTADTASLPITLKWD